MFQKYLFSANLTLPAALIFSSSMVGIASAHDAKSGFTYPAACCNLFDCRELDQSEVSIGPAYYIWTNKFSDKTKRIAFQSPKIRPSPDVHFHACENGHWGDTSGNLEITCFFVPTSG